MTLTEISSKIATSIGEKPIMRFRATIMNEMEVFDLIFKVGNLTPCLNIWVFCVKYF